MMKTKSQQEVDSFPLASLLLAGVTQLERIARIVAPQGANQGQG
jgi:hypothetical protein